MAQEVERAVDQEQAALVSRRGAEAGGLRGGGLGGAEYVRATVTGVVSSGGALFEGRNEAMFPAEESSFSGGFSCIRGARV